MLFEQTRLTRDAEHTVLGGRPHVADAPEQRIGEGAILHQRGVAAGDAHVGFRQHHLQVVDRGAKKRPSFEHLAQQRRIGRAKRFPDSVPARQHHPRLGPTEHPGDRAQLFDALGIRARRRARTDFELRDFAQRRHLPKKRRKPRRLVHQRAIRTKCLCRHVVHRGCEARTEVGRQGGLLERCQQSRGGDGFEIRGRAVAGAIFCGDDFPLLGDADAAAHGAVRLGANRGERRAASPADGAAPAMKNLHGGAGMLEDRRERSGRLA